MTQEIIESGCGTTVLENVIAWFNANNGFASAVLAFITVLAAVFIPMYIAKKQNKIALFEANLKCYSSLNSIMSFCTFISEFTTFADNPDPKAEVHSPIEASKGKYLELHDLLSDEKAMAQIRSSSFWKTTFTRDCINLDCEAICSGAFLTKAISLEEAKKIGDALKEFIVALFDTETTAVIEQKRKVLIESSTEIQKLINTLRKKLKV